MGGLDVPVEIMEVLGPIVDSALSGSMELQSLDIGGLLGKVLELVGLKLAVRGSVPAGLPEGIHKLLHTSMMKVLEQAASWSDEEKQRQAARVKTVVPYNTDDWSGYPVSRDAVLAEARALGVNLVVLAGDTHNGWASDLSTADGEAAGVEFATASVSSPGMETYFGVLADQPLLKALDVMPLLEIIFRILMDNLAYTNLRHRGYLLVTFTAERAWADWRYVSTSASAHYQALNDMAQRLSILAGDNRLHR